MKFFVWEEKKPASATPYLCTLQETAQSVRDEGVGEGGRAKKRGGSAKGLGQGHQDDQRKAENIT